MLIIATGGGEIYKQTNKQICKQMKLKVCSNHGHGEAFAAKGTLELDRKRHRLVMSRAARERPIVCCHLRTGWLTRQRPAWG